MSRRMDPHDEEAARGFLLAWVHSHVVALHRTRWAFSAYQGPIHWKCPDCMMPCRCEGEIMRRMPHKRCHARTRWDADV
jgi:hypothetical protein